MVSTKITILVLLVLSTIYTSESRGTYSTPPVSDSNNQNCFCLRSSEPYNVKVPEIIQSNKGLERLVIYMYRDLDNNQLKMHIPSKELQKQIPDLPFENNDELVPVSGIDMQTIFDRSPEKVGQEIGNLRSEDPKPLQNTVMNVVSDEEERLAVQYVSPKPVNHIYSNKIDSMYEEPSDPVLEYQQNMVTHRGRGPTIPGYPQKFVSYVVPYNVDKSNKRVKDPIPSYKNKIAALKYDVHKINEQPNKNRVPSISRDNIPGVVPRGQFGEWLVKEMKIFNNDHMVEGHHIDASTIGKFILQILYKNGMRVTDNGMIANSLGKAVNIQNFSLVPILIGDTTSHDTFLQRNSGVLSPQALPYMQAILVTTSQPLKVLGVIPLGKTLLPSSPVDTLSNIWKTILPKHMVKKTSMERIPNVPEKFFPYNGDLESKDLGSYSSLGNAILKPARENKNKQHKRKSSETQFFDDNLGIEDGYHIPLNFITMNANGNEDLSGTIDPDVERLFVPEITINEEPDEITSRDQDNHFNFIQKLLPKMHLRNILPDYIDWPFKSKNIPSNVKADQLSSYLPFKDYEISSVVRKNPMKALRKLSLIDLTKRKNIPYSIEKPIEQSGVVQMQALRFGGAKNLGNYGGAFDTLPISAIHVGLKPPVFPLQFDSGSRSGSDLTIPEISEKDNSSKNGAEVYDFLVGGEDDAGDGDFRIIGGNAATGSGTPLSNKGRSGFIY